MGTFDQHEIDSLMVNLYIVVMINNRIFVVPEATFLTFFRETIKKLI